jgi:Uma2 family endonuclease
MSTEATMPQDYSAVVSPDLLPDPEWDPPEPPTDLIFDDGVPLESNRHRIAINVLIDSALTALQGQIDSFVGGNMFVFYSREQAMNRDFRGPDFFVALEVDGSRERQGWVVWEEQGRYPDVIIELMSPSTAKVDLNEKKRLYERTFRTAEYYVCDPFDVATLQGWHLDASQRYQEIIPNDRGWLWCKTLELWLGSWEGKLRQEPATGTCAWLRFFDHEGTVVLLPEEMVEQEKQRAEREKQRAERLATRLRELGEDPDGL